MIEFFVAEKKVSDSEVIYYPEFIENESVFALEAIFHIKKLAEQFVENLNLGLLMHEDFKCNYVRPLYDLYDKLAMERMAYEAG